MYNVLELLSGQLLKPDLREGAKFFARSESGHLNVIGSRSGSVALWSDSSPEVQYLNVQPVRRKKKSEAELQGLWLSQTGDLLFAATSVDIVAINTATRTLAWDYQQKRQWGFLPSIPQGGYLSSEDELTIYYSSGEIVTLDRQSRVVSTESHPNTARFLVHSHETAFGSDGHAIWKWDKRDGFASRELFWQKPCYSMAISGDGSCLAIRSTNRVLLVDTVSASVESDIEIEPGLPQLIVNENGSQFGMLNESKVRFLDRAGALKGVFEMKDDFPISIHNCGLRIVVGMRSGKMYSLDWPD